MTAPGGLSRRERQIMDILYQRGKAAASEVREDMKDAPGYSAVRAMLRGGRSEQPIKAAHSEPCTQHQSCEFSQL